MNGKDVVDRAYDMVADSVQPRRNPASAMAGYLNDGARDLLARRPYLRLNDDGTQKAAYVDLTANNLTEEIPFDDWLREPLAHYIAYRVFEIDAEDEANTRQSQSHFAQYIRAT